MGASRREFFTALGKSAAAMGAFGALALPDFAMVPSPTASGAKPILLNSNENSYGCSERVVHAIRDAQFAMNRYPNDEAVALRERIAGLHGVKPERVTVGCGSSELLRMAVLSFLGPGKKVVLASPTYETVAKYSKAVGGEVSEVRLTRNWAHDLDAMFARVDARTGLVYICNPNNPTGSITPRKDIEAFLGKLPPNVYVLIDEAYYHYMNPTDVNVSFLDRPVDNPRVIVTRTFSKIYGLAGMRIGYGVTSPEVAERFKVHQLYNSVPVASIYAVNAALDDRAAVEKCAKHNADDRQEFLNQVNARMLRAIDSQTNFVMMNVARPVEEVIEHFKKHDILVGRKFPALGTYLRVSLGQPQEMEQFWHVWDQMAGNMKM
jgi:histidinol-phosphate aminotransferase